MLNFENVPELAERELCLSYNGWTLLDYYTPTTKGHFTVYDTAKQYLVDIYGQTVIINTLNENERFNLEIIHTDITDQDFLRWLDRKLQAINK